VHEMKSQDENGTREKKKINNNNKGEKKRG
jgi:hypothetical protein